MVILAATEHKAWVLGTFILQPLEGGSNTRELKARVLYMPKRSTGPSEIGMETDPVSLELTPIQLDEMPIGGQTLMRIEDGHIVTFRTSDPENFPLPDPNLLMLQSFLVRVLRFAHGWKGRRGHVGDF